MQAAKQHKFLLKERGIALRQVFITSSGISHASIHPKGLPATTSAVIPDARVRIVCEDGINYLEVTRMAIAIIPRLTSSSMQKG
jgi:hypothetical protein